MKTRTLYGLAAVVLSVAAFGIPARAHDAGGLLQPHIAEFVVEAEDSAGGRVVWLRVVDADSAQPAEGLRVTVAVGSPSPPLREVALGFYSERFVVTPGERVLTVVVQPSAGAPLVRKFEKTWRVTVPPATERKVVTGRGDVGGLRAAEGHPLHQAWLAAAEQGKALDVQLEALDDDTLASPLYVRLHVNVRADGTGQLDPTVYEVYGWAVNSPGERTEFVRLAPLDVVDPSYQAGTYGGVVILPRSGQWTMEADVLALRKEPTDPPIRIAGGSLAVERSGPALQRAGAAEDRLAAVKANLFNTIVLGLHSVAAAGWAVVLGLLGLLGFRRARALSPWARDLLERKVDGLVRASWLLTATVYVSGVYNLYRESPYGVPSNWSDLRQLLRLPFAGPYFLALSVKLIAYTVLLFGSFRLISAARSTIRTPRRSAALTPWGRAATEAAAEHDDELPAVRPPLSSSSSTLSGTSVMEAPPRVQLATTSHASGQSLRVLLPLMVGCGLVIIVCVTVLKAAHLLIELARVTS